MKMEQRRLSSWDVEDVEEVLGVLQVSGSQPFYQMAS